LSLQCSKSLFNTKETQIKNFEQQIYKEAVVTWWPSLPNWRCSCQARGDLVLFACCHPSQPHYRRHAL